MRRLLNTLYVTTQGAYLSREGETVCVRLEGGERLRVPVHNLEGIVCFGQVSASPFLLGMCAERGVGVSFLSERGRFLARVQGPTSGNVLLRRAQYRLADRPEFAAEVARAVVTGKVLNCRAVLARALRREPGAGPQAGLSAARGRLEQVLTRLPAAKSVDEIRGLEGEAARSYFGAFDHLVTAQKEDFHFRERSRRPPLDKLNALLSFLYTLLVHDVMSALEAVGLDPAVGFLHRDRPGRPGLALDLMEELRPVWADRLALTLVNRRQVKGKGFTRRESGAVWMDERTRKVVIGAYQNRKREELRHPFLGEKLAWGLVPFVQALLLARHLRGELEAYPPFLWR